MFAGRLRCGLSEWLDALRMWPEGQLGSINLFDEFLHVASFEDGICITQLDQTGKTANKAIHSIINVFSGHAGDEGSGIGVKKISQALEAEMDFLSSKFDDLEQYLAGVTIFIYLPYRRILEKIVRIQPSDIDTC